MIEGVEEFDLVFLISQPWSSFLADQVGEKVKGEDRDWLIVGGMNPPVFFCLIITLKSFEVIVDKKKKKLAPTVSAFNDFSLRVKRNHALFTAAVSRLLKKKDGLDTVVLPLTNVKTND